MTDLHQTLLDYFRAVFEDGEWNLSDEDELDDFRFQAVNNWKDGEYDIIKWIDNHPSIKNASEVIGTPAKLCKMIRLVQKYYKDNYGEDNLLPIHDFNCDDILRHFAYMTLMDMDEDDWEDFGYVKE